MFIWCWISTAISDPGRITDDLRKRGFLEKVQNGQIPSILKNFPICYYCQVPMPPNSHHCHKCNACQLSYDHHCGFIGNCIADKTTKSFYLSFFYGSIFGLIWAFFGFYCFIKTGNKRNGFSPLKATRSKLRDCVTLLASVYVGMLSFSVLLFAIFSSCNIHRNRESVKMKTKRMRKCSLLGFFQICKQFCFNLLMKLIPIQNETTQFAWPGVAWPSQYEI